MTSMPYRLLGHFAVTAAVVLALGLGCSDRKEESNNGDDHDCELQQEVPCTGEDCCPDGCLQHMGAFFDIDGECGLETATYGCSPGPESEVADAEGVFCTEDGQYAVQTPYLPDEDAKLAVVDCDNIDDFDASAANLDHWPRCE